MLLVCFSTGVMDSSGIVTDSEAGVCEWDDGHLQSVGAPARSVSRCTAAGALHTAQSGPGCWRVKQSCQPAGLCFQKKSRFPSSSWLLGLLSFQVLLSVINNCLCLWGKSDCSSGVR